MIDVGVNKDRATRDYHFGVLVKSNAESTNNMAVAVEQCGDAKALRELYQT